VNVSRLEELVQNGKVADGIINPEVLFNLGVIAKKKALVKILGKGELTAKLAITMHACSETAKQKIESLGGSITIL
jgi:large subunit ribosomal protein L15